MLWPLVLAQLACQEPFPEGRRDLFTFRIAAVSAAATQIDGQTVITAAALIAGEGGLYHRAAPALAWDLCGQPAEGPAPAATFDGDPWPCEIRLTAQSADQPDLPAEQAILSLSAAPQIPAVTAARAATDMTLQDADLPAGDRAERSTGEDAPVAAGGAVAVDLTVDPAGGDDRRTRWMSTAGTLRERDRHAADWFAGEVVLDDGEIESAEAIPAGIYSLAALTLDGAGGNGWRIVDVGVGVEAGGALAYRDRLLPVDAPPAVDPGIEAPFLATFTATQDGTGGTDGAGGPGYALSDLEPVVELLAAPTACGQPPGTPFDPGWLAAGICGTDDLDGQRVLVAGTVWP